MAGSYRLALEKLAGTWGQYKIAKGETGGRKFIVNHSEE
jgi:hypothetical protein